MRNFYFRIMFFLSLFLAASCSPDGRKVESLPVAGSGGVPQRIVSLGPSITEELYLLGVEDRIVGCTIYCNRPPSAKKRENVGTVMEVNVEKIVALKPDVVFATALTDRKAVAKFEKIGIPVKTLQEARSFKQICENFLEVGKIVGKGAEAENIVKDAVRNVDALSALTRGLNAPRVFVQTGTKPLFAANKNSFINDFIVGAGGYNITEQTDSKLDYGIYSREWVVKENPDVILIVSMGMAGETEKQEWNKYKTLKVAQTGRIHVIDPDRYCNPTPVSFVESIRELITVFYPDLKPGSGDDHAGGGGSVKAMK